MRESLNKKYIDSKACKILYMIGVLPFLLIFSCITVILQEAEMRIPRALVYFVILTVAFVCAGTQLFCSGAVLEKNGC